MKYEKRVSADGSETLYSKEYGECYHSLKDGAFKEALYKHVIPAFNLVQKPHLKILDICFGLGINTLTTLYYLEQQSITKSIQIFSPELDRELLTHLQTLCYPQELQSYLPLLDQLVKDGVYRSDNISIELYIGDARDYIKGLKNIDIVYQDAFSPKKNPMLWTVEYFKDIALLMNKEGVLTTYSIATPVRLALYEAGFRVYEMKPKDVRKITIASKSTLPLDEIDMERKKVLATAKPLRDNQFIKKDG